MGGFYYTHLTYLNNKEDNNMEKFTIELVWTKIQIALTAIGGWLGYFLGGMDGLLIALIVLMVIDYISGIMIAVSEKNLSSSIGFKGICRKTMILMMVGVANILDVNVVGTGSALRTAVATFFVSNEAISVTENAARLGLPIPEKLKEVLTQLHKGSNPIQPEGEKDEDKDKSKNDTGEQ